MSTRILIWATLDADGTIHFETDAFNGSRTHPLRAVSYEFLPARGVNPPERRTATREGGAELQIRADGRSIRDGSGDDQLPRALRWLITGSDRPF